MGATEVINADRGLGEAVAQSIGIGAVNSWLRDQPAQVVSTSVASLRDALAPYWMALACACIAQCG